MSGPNSEAILTRQAVRSSSPVRRSSPLVAIAAALALLLLPQWVPAQQFTFRQYSQSDGLSNLTVSSLLQDREGYLWIGTENGLFRHGSREFERFGDTAGLTDTAVRSIFEDGAGRLWVGTSHDLYLRDDHRFRAVRPEGHSISIGPGFRISSPAPDRLLVIDQGGLRELRLGSDDGEWHSRNVFSEDQLRQVPGLRHLTSLFAGDPGRLWLGCGEGICRREGARIDVWDARSGVPRDTWHSWIVDADGRLWVRGLQHIITRKPGDSGFELRDGPHVELTSGILNVPLIADPRGRIVTRSDQGLLRWQQDHWEEFTAENGITTPELTALLAGRDGTMWLGTSGHGLWRWLGYGTFESWLLRRGLSSNPVWVVLRGPDGAITLGTRSGCIRIDEGSREAQPCRIDGIPKGEIQVMASTADGGLWIGLATGQLLRVAPGERRARPIGLVPEMRMMIVDRSDRLWVCSDGGIRTLEHGSTRLETAGIPDGVGEINDAVEDDAGTIWFATGAGLLRWANNQWSLLRPNDPTAAGFATIAIQGQGWLWAAGASHGLLHLHVQGSQVDRAEWVKDRNVADAAVYFTQIDSRGWLWAGTDDGFSVYDGRVWRKFGQSDGLIWNDTDQNAVLADADGSMWIGTSGGVTHIVRPEQLLQSRPLDLRVALALIGGSALTPSAPQNVGWNHGPALDVHLQSLDYGDDGQTMLRARLRGLSDEWFTTRDFDFHYPGLAPGHYTFEAMALDPDHQLSSSTIQMSFEVQPPWWETRWFRLLTLVLVGATLAVLWRWSLLRLEARRRALERELEEREMLLERATRDPLTRLWNRQAILEILSREMETARASRQPLAIALIDIDHFKRINDSMGHLTGDDVLRKLSAQLSGRLRARDSLGRYGGEELLLILPEAAPQCPFQPVERLRQIIAELPFQHDGTRFQVTASFGVAWLALASDSAEDLIGRADEALYCAKDAGRDRVKYAATGS